MLYAGEPGVPGLCYRYRAHEADLRAGGGRGHCLLPGPGLCPLRLCRPLDGGPAQQSAPLGVGPSTG